MQKLTILKKVRGVMTRFEPLTEEFISAQSEDGLTYSELSAVLSSYGLDIRKVVHDPTRQIFNTYYADYDQGKYPAPKGLAKTVQQEKASSCCDADTERVSALRLYCKKGGNHDIQRTVPG